MNGTFLVIGIIIVAIGLVLCLIGALVNKRYKLDYVSPFYKYGITCFVVGIIFSAIFGGFWIKERSDDVNSYHFHENAYDLEAMYADLQSEGATIVRFEVPVEQGSEIAMLDDHGTITYAYYDACITPSPAPTVNKDKYEVDFEKYRKDN